MKIRNSRLEGLVGADLFWLTNTAPHAIYFYGDILVKACNRLGLETTVDGVVAFVSASGVCYKAGPAFKVHR
jgi:hypothetical protein